MSFNLVTENNKTIVYRTDGSVANIFYDDNHEASAKAWVENL